MRPPRDVVLDSLRRLERGDAGALDDVVDPDVVVYTPSGEVAFRERTSWKAALSDEPFTDVKIDVADIVCEGEKVVVRYRLECTQIRPFFGVAPTDRRITTSGTKIYRVRGGKIVEIAGHDDLLGVLRQLGVVELEA